jgi:hypothetical protein
MRQEEIRGAARSAGGRSEDRAGPGSATRVVWLSAILWVALGACASTRRFDGEFHTGEDPYEAADWRWQSASWGKLDAIETWLLEHGDRAEPELYVEAVLQLAEGRLELARRDAKSAHGQFLDLRLARAQTGFREAEHHIGANEAQRSRARLGAAAAEQLRAGGGVSTSVLPAVLSRREWGAATPIPARMNRHPNRWSRITVHHSAIGSSQIGGTSFSAEASSLRKIQRYHMHDPGHLWGDIGYHFLIAPSGRVFEGRPLGYQGAHVKDKNPGNLGVCLLGDFTSERPTPAALRSLEKLVDGLRAEHSIDRRRVSFHGEMVGGTTECPGPPLAAWVKSYRR